ncbi:MAG TPA: hypothetical protein VG621_00965 [Candidatus Paceibacterota bacterium]|nr:hypothetical protein [Candidatus Paceibacterota bacterium]
MTASRRHNGYSLIELVVYIALFILLSLVLIQALVSVMRTYATGARYRALEDNGELVMERITRELRNGSTATTSTCPTTATTITLASTDASGGTHTTIFGLSGGNVTLATDGGSAQAISTSDVTASTLTFCSFTTAVGTGVRVHLVLATTRGTSTTSAAFSSTILLRGT